MEKNAQGPNPGLIEKEYPYHYNRLASIGLIIFLGLYLFLMLQQAKSGAGIWFWLFLIFFFVLFLYFLYILFINLFGNCRLLITKKDLYLPVVWKSETYTLIPFSEITAVERVEISGRVFLRIFVRRKEYTIAETWISSIDSFNEILKIVNEKMKSPS